MNTLPKMQVKFIKEKTIDTVAFQAKRPYAKLPLIEVTELKRNFK